MNITLLNAWAHQQTPMGGPPSQADRGVDGKPAAFQQIMRVMEKDMWPGSQPGRMTGDRLPQQSTHRAAPRGNLQMKTDQSAVARASAPNQRHSAAPCMSTRSSAAFVEAARERPGTAQPARRSTPVRAAAATPPIAMSPARPPSTWSSEPCSTIPALTASPVATRGFRCLEQVAKTPDTNDTTPYLITVMSGTNGISIALRVSNASADQLESLRHCALAEARSRGARDVRLVVNGIDHTPTSSQGTSHGH